MAKKETRIERIGRYEAIFREVRAAVDGYREAERKLVDVAAAADELEKYYTGKAWKSDFAADEKGLLPDGLLRGVLSEDGVYDLLGEYGELRERIKNES